MSTGTMWRQHPVGTFWGANYLELVSDNILQHKPKRYLGGINSTLYIGYTNLVTSRRLLWGGIAGENLLSFHSGGNVGEDHAGGGGFAKCLPWS